MPSKRPGIMVRLDEGDYELVKRAAAASGMSMGGLLAEYVEMSRPMLQHLVGLADAMAKAAHDRREIHMSAVEGAMAKGQSLADVAAGQLSMVYDMLETATGAVNETNILLPELVRMDEETGSVVGLTPLLLTGGSKTLNPLPTPNKKGSDGRSKK